MTKTKRQDLILKLISEKEIFGQQELHDALCDLGVEVTQATISRDINELNLVKSTGITKKYRYSKAFAESNVSTQHLSLIKGIIVSIVSSNNLIVIKTHAGSANTVCKVIDEFNFNNVLGTIAGDDTIFMALNSKADAEVIAQKIKDLIKNA